MSYAIHIPIAEEGNALPQYFSGDIFKSKDGEFGIIAECNHSSCGWPPSYSAAKIPGYKNGKYAWWRADEWEQVLLGPLHALTNQWPDGFDPNKPTLEISALLLK